MLEEEEKNEIEKGEEEEEESEGLCIWLNLVIEIVLEEMNTKRWK